MSEEDARRSELREAYTLLVSVEPMLERQATRPDPTGLWTLLRDRVAEWVARYRLERDAAFREEGGEG